MKEGEKNEGKEHLTEHQGERESKVVTSEACFVDKDSAKGRCHEEEDNENDIELVTEVLRWTTLGKEGGEFKSSHEERARSLEEWRGQGSERIKLAPLRSGRGDGQSGEEG